MNYWEALQAARSGKLLMHRDGGMAVWSEGFRWKTQTYYVAPVNENLNGWEIVDNPWQECSHDEAMEALRSGGYEVETKRGNVWNGVRVTKQGSVVFMSGFYLCIYLDRKWRIRPKGE